jgi:hypothetical protein
MVGIIDLAVGQRRAGAHDLVAGRDERHAQRPVAADAVAPRRGDGRKLLGPEAGAGAGGRLAGLQVLAGLAGVGAGLEPRRHDDELALDLDVFLHDAAVGPFGHDGAGEDAGRFAGP